MRKTLLLAILSILSFECFAQWDGTSAIWTVGAGTQANPYRIQTPQHLAYLAQSTNSGTSYSGTYFILTNDISLNNQDWTPIGTSSHVFRGFFDGNGHTVSGININAENLATKYYGLFGYASNGRISNLTCYTDIDFGSSTGLRYAGGIVGEASSLTISNCHSDLSTYYDYWDPSYTTYVGGIGGFIMSCTINNCSSHCDIEGKICGGIAGQGSYLNINNCITDGLFFCQLTNDYNPISIAGGIIGSGHGNTINNCTSEGYLWSPHIAGGIIGRSFGYTSIIECTNFGDITVITSDTTSMYAGGIAGVMAGGIITKSYNSCDEVVAYAMNEDGYSNRAFASGIVPSMGIEEDTGVISYCFNTADIIITWDAYDEDDVIHSGLEYVTGLSPYFSNCCSTNYSYNIGNLEVDHGSNVKGIGGSRINGGYYRSGCGATSGGISKTATQMKSASFLNLLNIGETPFEADINDLNDGYPILHFATRPEVWTLTADSLTSYSIRINGDYYGVADSVGFIYKQANTTDEFSRITLTTNHEIEHFTISGLQPNTEYKYCFFAHWDNEIIYGDTLMASTRPFYTVTVTANDNSRGTVTGNGQFAYGDTDTLTASAIFPYTFSQWDDGNNMNPRVITVTYNSNYMAIFELSSFSVSLLPNNYAWGSVTGSNTYTYGDQAFCLASPAYGYEFVMWSDSITDNPRFITVTNEVNLTAIFAPQQYTITVISNDTNMGHVYGGGTADYNSSIQIFAVPTGNHEFSQWSDGNRESIRTVTVMGNVTYMAIFTDIMYNIVANSNDENYGYVTGGGPYAHGSIAELEAHPYYGYHFSHWLDGAGNTSNPRIVTVNSDATYTAVFVPNVYNITVVSNNNNQGTVRGGGSFNYNSQTTIEAFARSHQHFLQWNDGITTNPRLIVVTQDSTFTAYFQQDPHDTIIVQSDDQNRGMVEGSGVFWRGDTITISATAFTDYTFSHWNDGNTEETRSIIVNGNNVYTAFFSAPRFTVTVTSNDEEMGIVSGGGSYERGEHVILTATPSSSDYQFVSWSNGTTENPYAFNIYSDVNIQANFSPVTGIDMSDGDNSLMIIQENRLNFRLTGAEGKAIRVIDVVGREVFSESKYLNTTIKMQTSGVYLVIVDGVLRKKIVIIH